MEYLCPFFIAFSIIFFSELGDKTQILVLSFSSRNKAINVLLGVALGSLLSHGLAILLGSQISLFGDSLLLKLLTYISFLIFGIIGFLPEKKEKDSDIPFLQKISNLCLNSTFIIALSIALGELGDKTLLASVGLGIDYPCYKISLILGSIFGMVSSNSVAIFFGKFLSQKLSENTIKLFSNIIFITFGIIGLAMLLFNS